MSDASLRELEHALKAQPSDLALSRRFLTELKRAGLVEPDALEDVLEPLANPGIAKGDLVLVTRRSRPRAAYVWLPEMDALLGSVLRVTRVQPPAGVGERDGLSCLVEGPSLVGPGGRAHGTIGRSFGFASLRRL